MIQLSAKRIFGALLAVALIAAILALTFLLKNKAPPNLAFWQKDVIYQIYPRSFKDSNGDGIGDLKGISSQIPYLKDLGIGAVWLSPFYSSPMADFGYDISNFTDVDPIFGTLSDFDQMLEAMHELGIKVILDYVPNHSSNKHEWFLKSVQNDPKFRDYYVWVKCNNSKRHEEPPNNWLSIFGGSAWQWHEERQEFYYHNFLKEQPDLNYRNPNVVDEMKNVLRFWLDRGVDGFRVDALKYLFEVDNVCGKDEMINTHAPKTNSLEYQHFEHTYTRNQHETLDMLKEFRSVLQEYAKETVLIVEIVGEPIDKTIMYYGTPEKKLADFPFNFFLIDKFQNRQELTGTKLKEVVNLWIDYMPDGMWPNWVLGSHDCGRIASRLGTDIVDTMNMYSLLLPGTPITYYGEEIGMENTLISSNASRDPLGNNSRDPERTPMQWNNSSFAGFTRGNGTWLPLNKNYIYLNVDQQRSNSQSSYKVYKKLVHYRKLNAFLRGTMDFPYTSDAFFTVRRTYEEEGFLIVINTSTKQQSVNLHMTAIENNLPDKADILVRSSFDHRKSTKPRKSVDLRNLNLLGGEGLLLKL